MGRLANVTGSTHGIPWLYTCLCNRAVYLSVCDHFGTLSDPGLLASFLGAPPGFFHGS